MSNHIAKAKQKMGIYAKRRVRNVLTGNYGSVFKGRGMDFDDLRPYDYGDDVKDIDWKASARSRSLMIRRYVAVRKHNIMVIIDAGRNMAALTPSGEVKSEVAALAVGVLANIAVNNGDLFGITFGDASGNTRFPLKEGLMHAEDCLNKYEKAVSLNSEKSNLDALLSYVSKNFRERMFLFIITDEFGVANLPEAILRRLCVRHEQMIVMIEDTNLTNQTLISDEARDIVEDLKLSRYFRNDRKLKKAEEKMRGDLKKKLLRDLRRLGICSCSIENSDLVVPNIFKMLEEKKHAKR